MRISSGRLSAPYDLRNAPTRTKTTSANTAFTSEVGTGWREANASIQKSLSDSILFDDDGCIAFASEVGTGSREANASNKELFATAHASIKRAVAMSRDCRKGKSSRHPNVVCAANDNAQCVLQLSA